MVKVYLERANWRDTLCLAIGVSWEDWHSREFRIWLDFIVWSVTLNFNLGRLNNA